MSTKRRYEDTSPWLTFTLDLGRIRDATWLLLGEVASKAEHVAGVPLKPEVADKLMRVYLSKGAHGTTSIEGNTLSEDEVLRRVEGQLDLPVSRSYLGEEIDNVVDAYNTIISEVLDRKHEPINGGTLRDYQRRILDGQPLKDGVVPGEFRTHSVGVNDYLAPPAEDADYLVERLGVWLENGFNAPESRVELVTPLKILRAIMAHLYVAWIHPFGDGNGRVARLVEFQLLVEAGLPLPACHVLSDHYNRTRDAYYAALSRTSKVSGYPVEDFIHYAVQGFADELREQIDMIRNHQMDVTWENYVHDVYRDRSTPACLRQKHIALDLPVGKPTPRSKIRMVSARVAEAYAGKTSKTVTRDLNALEEAGLIWRNGKGISPHRGRVQAFLPPRADWTLER